MRAANCFLVGALLGLCGTGLAQATTISVAPTTQQVNVGNQFQVAVAISGVNSGAVPALGAWDINLSFDPSVLNFQNAAFGNQLDILGLGDIQSVSFLA